MRNAFDEQLDLLNTSLLEMGGLIENAITRAVKALTTQDAELAQEIMIQDDAIDNKEKEIESICIRLLLLQQPVAKDLRIISTALKMITDMERIGDHASDISEITTYLTGDSHIVKHEFIPLMAEATIKMVNDSLDAYVKMDEDLANEVIKHDDYVDDLFLKVKISLAEMVHQNSDSSMQAMDLLMIAKYFERIGDHAVNIAEWVIFYIKGVHKNKKIL